MEKQKMREAQTFFAGNNIPLTPGIQLVWKQRNVPVVAVANSVNKQRGQTAAYTQRV